MQLVVHVWWYVVVLAKMSNKLNTTRPGLGRFNSSMLPPQYPMVEAQGLDKMGSAGLLRQTTSPPGIFMLSPHTHFYLSENEYASARGTDDSANGYLSPNGATIGLESSHVHYDTSNRIKQEEVVFADLQKLAGEAASITTLSHHLSLPKIPSSSSKMHLNLQEMIPCKIRAKRGCATHPRSIAERVRRTKISERMRKLEEVVPNMERQTSTADMLDLAVDYIKNLQKQYKVLSDGHTNCKCSASRRSF